jgi:hypothetical protein
MADTDKKTVAELREVIDATNDAAELDALEAAEGPDGRKGVLEAIEKRRAQLAAESEDESEAERADESPAPAAASGARKKADETVPGGRYRNASGVLVNAHGQPIEE